MTTNTLIRAEKLILSAEIVNALGGKDALLDALDALDAGDMYVTRYHLELPDGMTARQLMTGAEYHVISTSDSEGCQTGYAGIWDKILYLPSVLRAGVLANGDPRWFDASSLEEAIRIVENDEIEMFA